MQRDGFIEQTPFFTDEHARLAASVSNFAAREVEPFAHEEGGPDADANFRSLLSLLAPEHVRDFWLERARAGKSIAAFALTEPEAGSDVSSIQTTAQREGDSYVITGRKCFISNAGLADFYTVFARTGTRADGRAELSAFIVGARMPGFRVAARTPMVAEHPIGEVEFDGVRVPAEDRVGAEGDGFRLAMLTMDMFRASVGAAACGMARRALDEAVAPPKARRQFGVTLAMHQLVQEKL